MLRWLGFNRLGTHILTWRKGELVGEDEAGNRYHRQRGARGGRRERRWVVYAGHEPDPTLVPAGWSGWLHHRLDRPPSERPLPQPRFERPVAANPTGTDAAYLPAGHLRRGGKRAPATGDYEAWIPDSARPGSVQP